MAGTVQPLVKQVPIVNADGSPTEYFIRLFQEKQIDISKGITKEEAQALIDEGIAEWASHRDIIAGTALTGGGNLSSDVTIDYAGGIADQSDVNLTTPPTDGQVLVYDLATNKWLPADQAGGGGGFAWRVAAVGTGASQDIFIPYSGLTSEEIFVFSNGLKVYPTEYIVAGSVLTITTNASGDVVEVFGPVGSPAPDDPYWANVVFLLHGEGADGSQVFTDLSSYGRVITPAGAVQVDTDISVGDSPSILFGSDANYLSGAYGSELDITTTSPNFCMEAYVYCTQLAGVNNQIYGRRRNSGGYILDIDNGNLRFLTFNGTTGTARISVASGMAINTVYHICIVRVDTTYYAFVDGVLVGSSTSGAGTVSGTTAGIYVGQSETDQPARFWRGNLNWLRITMGVPRYNLTGFTPPSVPYPMG